MYQQLSGSIYPYLAVFPVLPKPKNTPCGVFQRAARPCVKWTHWGIPLKKSERCVWGILKLGLFDSFFRAEVGLKLRRNSNKAFSATRGIVSSRA
jgi:hypothetical protein